MKKAKVRFYKTSNAIIFGLLALFGFASCSKGGTNPNPGPNPINEYGTPYATFIVKGKVTSNTGNPIENIRVVMKSASTISDTAFTDSDGNYQDSVVAFPDTLTFQLDFKDIDGASNGDYNSLDTTSEFTNPKFTGGAGWYAGETSKDLNIKLDKK